MEKEKKQFKEPPHDHKLEQQVLGSILLNDKLMMEIIDSVKVVTFDLELHQKIFTAMLYLHHNQSLISYESVSKRLQSKENESYIDYLIELGGAVVSDKRFIQQVEMLKDIYQKRELYNLSHWMVTQDIDGVVSGNLVKKIEGTIENMGITNNIEYEEFSEYINDWVDDLEDDTPLKQFKFGYPQLDDTVLVSEEDLTIIAARPSVGKSAFSTNIVKSFCMQGYKPLFVSLEMSKKKFMNRLVSNMANVEVAKFKRKEKLSSDEWKRVLIAKKQISEFDFSFYDKGGMTVEQLVGLCKYLKKRDKLDIVVIDYLQLLRSNAYKGQKQNQVGHISQTLKQLSMELGVPVIALSQLNRASIDNGKPREPFLTDLRDSGSLEQDADIVMMLHTDDVENKFQDRKFIKLFIRKNRDGRLSKIDYTYYGDYTRFMEVEWVNSQPKDVGNIYDNIQDNEQDILNDLPF